MFKRWNKSIHNIPYFNNERAEAKRRRKVWVGFVSAKRLFVPSKLDFDYMLGSFLTRGLREAILFVAGARQA